MLALPYRAKERIEAPIELAFEIAGRNWSHHLLLGTKVLQRLLELAEGDLDDAQRALVVEDADKEKFLAARECMRHENLALGSGVIKLAEGLALPLSPQLSR